SARQDGHRGRICRCRLFSRLGRGVICHGNRLQRRRRPVSRGVRVGGAGLVGPARASLLQPQRLLCARNDLRRRRQQVSDRLFHEDVILGHHVYAPLLRVCEEGGVFHRIHESLAQGGGAFGRKPRRCREGASEIGARRQEGEELAFLLVAREGGEQRHILQQRVRRGARLEEV